MTNQEAVDDFLTHYGVLGMKWGVRRYQNPDGTRKKGSSVQPKPGTGQPKVHRNAKGDKLKAMSDEDLQRSINRIRDEKTYKSLTSSTSRGSKFVKEAIEVGLKPLATVAVTVVATTLVNNLLTKNDKLSVADISSKVVDTSFKKLNKK